MSERPIFTYQTRPVLDAAQVLALDAYAELYGCAERSLFAAMQAGGAVNDLKREFLPEFDITARQFNAMRIGLEGKIDSIKERRPELIAETGKRIRKAAKVVAKLEKNAPGSNKLHQKKRRLTALQDRLVALKSDQETGIVRLCFGSKKLFHAQFDLQANGYADHDEWKADWQRERSSQFFVLGSQDETAGCQGCQATLAQDGTLNLQLRLPNAMTTSGKYLNITGIRFAYGHEQIIAALGTSQRIHTQTKDGKPSVKRIGTALSYRFVRDDKGWRIFVSVEARPVKQVSRQELGAIGVDVNADHLAVSEMDRFGNLIGARRIDLVTYGKTQDQAKALIGDAAVALAAQAQAAGKPIVLETLNFQKKKAELETTNPKQARMISSFACNKIASSIKAAAFRAGIEVIEVNPAYTSVIGAVNFAQAKGISVHQGAAYAIARRGLGLSERPTVREAVVPTRNGGHVTFALPARNRAKHVWSFWSKVRTSLKAAHVAHFRCGAHKTAPPPLPLASPGVCPIWNSTARSRGANRSQNCSGNVWPDVPF
ncbi:MAG: IS200/IS605 family accessory protein TnpB-related protein [Rhodoferax sp.]|nr:IS200/IS605 family accessory protein TnpB-related protein [Rhodoferax sp.]